MSDPSGRWANLRRILRVRTRLQFFALALFLMSLLCMAGLQRDNLNGRIALVGGILCIAAITVFAYRMRDP